MENVTERTTSLERIEELIAEHEAAIEILEACRIEHSMATMKEEDIENIKKWGFPGMMKNFIHRLDIYNRAFNRLYRCYFNKWILKGEEMNDYQDGIEY